MYDFLKVFVILLLMGGAVKSAVQYEFPKRIALSIDDAPSPDTSLFTGKQRAIETIRQLKEAKAPPVGIFAIGQHVSAFGAEQLKAYADAGHAICNHTFTHTALRKTSIEGYIQDITRADTMLKNMQGYAPLFRFPYLDEGSQYQSRMVRKALDNMGYICADVTVNNCDYYMNSIIQKAIHSGKHIDFDKLRKVYVQVMLECVEFFDGLASLQGKHPMNHVLLMHANDLTALYLGDLLQALRDRGWSIISIHNAYKPVPINFKNKTTKIVGKNPHNPARLGNLPRGMSIQYLSELFRQEKVILEAAS